MFSDVVIAVPYFRICCLLFRILLILLSCKFSKLNLLIVNKLVVIASVFAVQDASLLPLAITTLVFQIFACWLLAFSGEQRRGSFD